MSTHRVEVVRLGSIEKHPNADTLGLVAIWGYTAMVRLGDFKEGDLAAYIEPDYVVPDTPQFAFLAGHLRIKAKRLRGIYSQGLLVKAPDGAEEGDDVMECMGIVRYEPNVKASLGGDNERPPEALAWIPKYDLENWRRHNHLIVSGEPVSISEKLHGCCGTYSWREGRMWCKSRTGWKKQDATNLWWKALAQNTWIEDWCKARENMILFGEVFGQVQTLKYGAKPGQIMFRAFDVLIDEPGLEGRRGRWANAKEFHDMVLEQDRVPVLYEGPFDVERAAALSLGDSVLASHMAEGVVIRPMVERVAHVGRVVLKLVSDRYLVKDK